MTAAQLGNRMGVSQPTVQKLEMSEAGDTIQLKTLRRAAEALNCELVYLLVPRQPLQTLYDTAARDIARRDLNAVSHAMALEDQAVDDADDDERLQRAFAEGLAPRDVWARGR
jgi:predicted DNA-binding mobile mystery protein A